VDRAGLPDHGFGYAGDSMKKYLGILAFAFGAFFLPREAQAVSCPQVHTFVNGETLTAANLNANPSQFASCLQNIDYRNVGSAGIFASQIIPQTAAQATFGGSVPYTFSLPPNFSAPLTQANGGTGSANGSINGITLSNTGYASGTTGLVSDGFNINLDANGNSGIGIGYDGGTLREVQFGPSGNWASITGTDFTMNGNITATGNSTITGPLFNSPNGGYQVSGDGLTTTIFSEPSSGNIAFYNNTGNYDVGVEVDMTNGYLKSHEFRVDVPNLSNLYTVPFDANSISASRYTHLEHGTVTTASVASGYGCSSTISFQVGFAAAPHLTLTLAGGPITTIIPYYQNRNTSGFQACVYQPTTPTSSGVTLDWMAFGE
jgi:hypothetical protein